MSPAPDFSIDPQTGALRLAGVGEVTPLMEREAVEALLAGRLVGTRDHRNGFLWREMPSIRFGGLPGAMAICFFNGQVSEAGWNVLLPNAVLVGGWPTRETSDAEVAFVRRVLAEQVGRPVGEDGLDFPWGHLWAAYDNKGGAARAGIRYRTA